MKAFRHLVALLSLTFSLINAFPGPNPGTGMHIGEHEFTFHYGVTFPGYAKYVSTASLDEIYPYNDAIIAALQSNNDLKHRCKFIFRDGKYFSCLPSLKASVNALKVKCTNESNCEVYPILNRRKSIGEHEFTFHYGVTFPGYAKYVSTASLDEINPYDNAIIAALQSNNDLKHRCKFIFRDGKYFSCPPSLKSSVHTLKVKCESELSCEIHALQSVRSWLTSMLG